MKLTFLNIPRLIKKYKSPKLLWGLKPNKIVVKSLNYIKTGTVLDLGAGEGRNSIFLSKKGFTVTALDISKEALEKCRELAKDKKLKIKTLVSRIEDFTFKEKYNYILSVATLHLVEKDKVLKTIKLIKENTKTGGINLLTVFTNKDPGIKQFPDLYFFKETELKTIYRDWEILHFENYTKHEGHDGPHTHQISAIIARKI